MNKANLILFCVAGILAIAAPVSVVTQQHQIEIAGDFTGKPLPRFSNGAILSYDPGSSTISAFNASTGKLKFSTPLSITGATQLRVIDMAMTQNGAIAASTSAIDSAQGTGTSLIIWITPAGAISQIVRTVGYAPMRMTFGPDNLLWTAGRSYTVNSSKVESAASYDVIRAYDLQGKLKHTSVPNTSFSADNPALYSFLLKGSDRIGFLSATSKEFVEVSLSGAILKKTKLSFPFPSEPIVGAALTPDGSLYISLTPKSSANQTFQGPPLYRLDPNSGAFTPVQLANLASLTKPTRLLGSDGEKLVFYSKPPASVSWFSLN